MSRFIASCHALRRGKKLTTALAMANRPPVLSTPRTMTSGVTAPQHDHQPLHNGTNLRQQTRILSGAERIRISTHFNEACFQPDQYYSEVSTVYEAFKRGQKVSDDGPFLGARTGPNGCYEWMSFSQVDEKSRLFGSGLIAKGEKANGKTCIGIFSQNRPEWTLTDLACAQFSMVSVPLYNSLGWKACTFIVNKTRMSTLVVDTVKKALTIVEHVSDMPTLKRVVVMDLPSGGIKDLMKQYNSLGLELCSFEEVARLGVQHIADQILPSPDDLNTICFTSGTTGVPKGVPLRHRNHIANHACIFSTYEERYMVDHMDLHFSLLPIAHVYERGNIYNVMMTGTPVGFFGGDMLRLTDDAQALKPTIFTGVPRLYNRLYDKIKGAVDGGSVIKRAIFNRAYSKKLRDLENGTLNRDTVWDKIVFKRIQDILGGRVKYLFTGGAPISGEVITFMRCVFGCSFIQAYGATETTSCIARTLPSDPTNGHVGTPGGGTQIKLVDVPELEYFSSENKGEICVKGNNVFDGYLDDPEETANTIDEDGWMHTGDIGEWTDSGALKLIDRKKHIFKIAQGVYVAPEKVENIYVRNHFIMQIFVYGDTTKASLVGIVVPDAEALPAFVAKLGVEGSLAELCRDEKVKSALLANMHEYASKEGLLGFEQVKDIRLHDEPFTEENGLLTPSLKNKRPDITKAFEEDIRDMYTNLD